MSKAKPPKPRESKPLDEQNLTDPIASASRHLFLLGRMFSRQSLREKLAETDPAAAQPELSQILIVQQLEVAEQQGRQLSVGELGRELNIDPSTASRFTAQTLKAGYIERVADQRDARASRLRLTPAGRELSAQAQAWQQEIFLGLTRDWSAAERRRFATQFIRFSEALLPEKHPAPLDSGGENLFSST